MADTTGDKIMLKALVRKWQNQVLFIESDDFADVLFSFLTLPIGTIIRLGQKHPVPAVRFGCMNNLYSTVSDMDASLFRNETCRDLLLCPRNWADSHCKNLKLKIDTGEPLRYFLCSRNCNLLESDDGMCDSKSRGKKRKVYVPKKEKEIKSYSQKEDTGSLSYYKDAICRCGARMDKEVNLSVPLGGGAFLKERAGLIISDDLQVMPPGSIVSLFQKLGVRHGETIVEMNFSLGVDEVLKLVMSSLASQTPLSDTLLKNESIPNFRIRNGTYRDPPLVGKDKNHEGKISLKLMICKSSRKVCYAEAGEDFVNFLLSFLTLPLGFIVKQIQLDSSSSLTGCIDKLYKSVKDLDEQHLISSYHKEMLLNPKLVRGFGYENSLLEIEKASHYRLGSVLTATDDRKLSASFSSVDKKSSFSFSPMRVVDSKSQHNEDTTAQGFLQGPAKFIVTDSLVIKPQSAIFILSFLNSLHVQYYDIEERIVYVGKEEALRLMVASFLGENVLSNAFVRNGPFRCINF